MIKQDFKIGLNRLLKFKLYSFINICGLAIAVASALVIFSYALHHLKFDKNISNGENSYRIISRIVDGTFNANTFAVFGNYLSDCPEVESYSLNYYNRKIDDVFIKDRKIKVHSAIFVNESFFNYFSINIIKGNKASIQSPNTIMLTPEMAQKLFPNTSAMGKTVLLRSLTKNQDSLIAYTVSGIIAALPKTSHLHFEMLLSQKGHFEPTAKILDTRKVFGGLIYVKLYPSTQVKDFEEKLTLLTEPTFGNAPGPPLDAFNHQLQKVYDIHFTQGLINETEATVRRSFINILLLIGLIIIILATVNFVIINIARQSFLKKTSFIIKIFGGSKLNLLNQAIIEIFTSISLSFLMAYALLVLSENYMSINFFIENDISIQNPNLWLISLFLFIAVNIAVIALTYINLIRGNHSLQPTNKVIKINTAILLVVFQFTIVIVLIGFAISINLQMRYINDKALGYSKDNVLIIKVPQSNAKVHILKQELALIPGIYSTGTAFHYPGYHLQDMNPQFGGYDFSFKFGFMDYDAIETLEIKPLKFFSPLKEKASNVWMINESFYQNLKMHFTDEQIGSGNLLGDNTNDTDDPNQIFNIGGIIKDFHYSSLHSKIENFAFYIAKPKTKPHERYNRFVLAKLDPRKIEALLPEILDKINEIYPEQPVHYSFLDEELSEAYMSENTLVKLINIFSMLSIIIACLGLTGLTLLIIEKRTKEIGIRKVNGASVFELVKLINKDFIKFVALAFILAVPMSYYAANIWLKNFAYQIELSWWIFALAGLISLCIALATVSWQTYRAAIENPIHSLRNE